MRKMKLLVQADDYGISRAVARGIVYGVENGIIRNTGMFANMPWAEECVEWIRPHLDKIAFGIDLNLTTGKPLLSAKTLPTLTTSEGDFHTSWASRKLDADLKRQHTNPEEVYWECKAQIQKFIQIVGKKPDYIHSHAYTTQQIVEVQRMLSKEYEIPYSADVWKCIFGCEIADYRMEWYRKPSTLENQKVSSLKQYLLEHESELLSKEYNLLVGHMGYVDKELMELSTYSLYRINDLEAVTSPEIIRWANENPIELMTYRGI